jgi:hypothetical protein
MNMDNLKQLGKSIRSRIASIASLGTSRIFVAFLVGGVFGVTLPWIVAFIYLNLSILLLVGILGVAFIAMPRLGF